jgi:hypothetical protein
METYKGWIIKTGASFIAILLALTFFSNTIYTFNLPSIRTTPSRGGLKRQAL